MESRKKNINNFRKNVKFSEIPQIIFLSSLLTEIQFFQYDHFKTKWRMLHKNYRDLDPLKGNLRAKFHTVIHQNPKR